MNGDGFVQVDGGKVYYKITGEGKKPPLLVLHGGPGFSHDIFRKLDPLGNERPIVYYDQLGAGKSDRPKDKSLWVIERFVKELGQIREALELEEVYIYSASWGTMLCVDYLISQPKGVRGVILAHPCLSASKWKRDTTALLKELPLTVQQTIKEHEEAGTTDSEPYQAAFMEFVKKYVCRIEPMPNEVIQSFADANMDVYQTMWGPSEWFPVGNLKDYERVENLRQITTPALFLCGEYDEARPETVREYKEALPGSEIEVIEGGSHFALWEREEQYLRVIRKFLN